MFQILYLSGLLFFHFNFTETLLVNRYTQEAVPTLVLYQVHGLYISVLKGGGGGILEGAHFVPSAKILIIASTANTALDSKYLERRGREEVRCPGIIITIVSCTICGVRCVYVCVCVRA